MCEDQFVASQIYALTIKIDHYFGIDWEHCYKNDKKHFHVDMMQQTHGRQIIDEWTRSLNHAIKIITKTFYFNLSLYKTMPE